MKYFIVHKNNDISLKVKRALQLLINGTVNELNPDVVFTVGGDGTVLKAVRKYLPIIENIKIVAINTGNLGFYTQFLPTDLNLIYETVLKQDLQITYPLLAFEIDGKKDYALNEITVSSGHKLLKADLMIDDEKFMKVVANGICVSTPSGSTAYNKSLGGAIMDPSLDAVQLTLIAPFTTVDNQMISPFVVSDQHKIKVKPENNKIDVTFDQQVKRYENIEDISVYISNKRVTFLKIDDRPFVSRVKEKFILKN